MKKRKRLGYVVAVTGTVMLGCSAFVYCGHKGVVALAAFSGLLLFIIGAGWISRAVKEERAAGSQT